MKNIMKNRFSCRNFKSEKIDDKLIMEILDETRLTPSSWALEPWKFMVVSGESVKKLGEICYHQPHVINCSHAVIIIARTDLRSKDKYLKTIISSKGKTQVKIDAFFKMVSTKMDSMSDKELENYASLQCYMALANLVNIAEAKGIKSCIIGGFEYDKLVEFIDMGTQYKPAIVVALGLSDDEPTPKIRQPLEELVLFKN